MHRFMYIFYECAPSEVHNNIAYTVHGYSDEMIEKDKIVENNN